MIKNVLLKNERMLGMFTFESSNSKTYLVYSLKADEKIDKLSIGMMSNNKIKGFLPVSYTQIDEKRLLKYDVTSMISASQIFSGTVNRKWVLGVFSGITNAMIEAEEFMINPNAFIIDLEYIYVDVSTTVANIVCLPVINDKTIDFKAFFKNIMFSAQFDSSENNDYVAQIISYLNNSTTFSPHAFRDLLNVISKGSAGVKPISNYTVNQSMNNSVPVSTPTPVPATVPVIQPVPAPSPQFNAVNQVNNNVNCVPAPNNQPVDNKKINKQSSQHGFNVPNGNGGAVQSTQVKMPPNASPAVKEKKMSMFYLMCHYNKENAQKYKAQKQNKNINNVPSNQMSGTNVPVQNNTNTTVNGRNNFAVPGQPSVTIPNSNNMNNSNSAGNFSSVQQSTNTKITQPVINTVQQNPMPQQTGSNANPVVSVPPQQMNTVSADFGSTTVLGGGYNGETTVLGAVPNSSAVNQGAVQAFIIRERNNEKIPVNKPVFRIGKERSYVDYFIGDNSYISRGHANIIERDGKYYIVDNNSRNHTYVNGNLITSSTEIELKNGDTFKLANEAFEFKLF